MMNEAESQAHQAQAQAQSGDDSRARLSAELEAAHEQLRQSQKLEAMG